MTTVQRTTGTILFVFLGLLVAATLTWFTVADSTLIPFLVKRLEAATDTRMSYQGDATITRTWASPTLSVNELVIDDTEGHFHIESDSLTLQISLPRLFIGRLDVPRLWIGVSRIDITKADSASQIDLEFPILRLQPTLRDVQISQSTITLDGETYQVPEIVVSDLTLRKSDEGIPELFTHIALGKETFDIKAVLPITDKAQTHQQLPFSIFVNSDIVDASIAGQVDLNQPTPVVTATLDADLRDLEHTLAYINLDIPGELQVRAQLTGPVGGLALEDLSANWSGPGQSSVKLDGRIGDVVALRDIELSLTGQLDEADWLSPFLPETLGALDTAEVTAELSGDQSRLDISLLDLKTKTAANLELSLSGDLDLVRIVGQPELENLDLVLGFNAPTTRAARILLFDTVPELGAITGNVEVRAETGDPAIENIVIHARDERGIQADLSGRIDKFPLHPDKPNRGYDIDVTMKASQTSIIAEQIGLDLPISGPLDVKYRIEGDTQALQLNQIALTAGEKKGSLLKAKGKLLFREWEQEDPLDALDLVVDFRSDTEFLSVYAAQELPPLTYNAHARFHTMSGQHRVDDIRVTSVKGEPLQITESGSVERITFLPTFGVEGFHIKSHIRTNDISTLNTLFKLDDVIPAAGSLEWRATLTGTDRKLLIDKVSLQAGRGPDFRLVAKGRLGYISAEKKWQLEDTDLKVTAHSDSSQSLTAALGHQLPELGPVQANATINDKNKKLGIHSFRMLIGEPGNPVLDSTGTVGDLYAFKTVRIDTKLHLGREEFGKFSQRHQLPDLGSVTGAMRISDKDGTLGIDSLHIESSDKENFSLYVDGRFGNFRNPGTLSLDARLTARDMKLVGALLDRDWPDHGRVVFRGLVTQPGKETLLNATLTSGKEKIEIALSGDFDATPPHIKGEFRAQNFFLPGLAEIHRQKRAEKIEERKRRKEKGKKQADLGPVFSRTPLDVGWLKAMNMVILVDIESFDRQYSEAVSAKMQLTLKSGRLSADPATLVYPEGEAQMNLQLVANDPLEAKFLFVGENLNPWKGLNIEGDGSTDIYEADNARANVNISLNSSGKSPHELASNLQGDFYVSITEGKIAQSLTHLLFIDIAGWASDQKKERYDNVNCAIADYRIENGIITTDAFFMDTRRITIAGEGTVDLGKELIDYMFIPKKKSRLIAKAEPVKITGPLNDPTVRAIPAKSLAVAAGKAGTLLFAPYVLAGIVAGEYSSGAMQAGDEDTSACREYAADKNQDRRKQDTQQ
jgi:uncharacterized protein involved in outer membrane biogenesis